MYFLIPAGCVAAILFGTWLFYHSICKVWNEAHEEDSDWDGPWNDEW